jgi:hypothetical protein
MADMKKQAINISMRQYVDNPYRGSAFLASRKAIKQGLNVTFVKLLSRFRQQFFAVPYLYPNGDVLFHVKVPSEEYDKNKIVYDVLFRIYEDGDPSKRYSQRRVKMFSNSPSFLFTYAYVYYHSDLIINDPNFVSKLPQIAIIQPPVIRNPVESLGFEKSTYVAARYLIDGFILNEGYIKRFGIKMNPIEETRLLSAVADPQLLVQLYAHAKEIHSKTKSVKKVNVQKREAREKMRQEYIQRQKASKPKKSGFIFKRSPQSKITPKEAKRRLMND